MKKLLDAVALTVVLGGAAFLAHPAPASATYLDPWGGGSGGNGENYGIEYCCETTGSASCCHMNSGCATKPGMCIKIPEVG